MSKRLLRNATFGMIGSVATIGGSFASGMIVARVLGVEGTGLVTYAIWLATTGVTLVSTGLPFTLGRYLPELTARGEHDEARRLGASMLRPYMLIGSLPAIAMAAYAAWLWSHPATGSAPGMSALSPEIWLLASICGLTQTAADYGRGYLRGMQRFDRVARFTIVSSILQPLVILVGGITLGVTGALIGYAVGNVIPATLLFSVSRTKGELEPALKKRVLSYAGYRWAAEIMAAFVWARLEVLFLESYVSTTSVGLFTVGLTIANLAIQGPMMLTWGLIPHFSERVGLRQFDRLGDEFAAGTRLMSFLIMPSCFGLSAIMPRFLPLLYGSDFQDAVVPATVLVCGAGIAATSQIAWNVLWAMERADTELYFGVIGALIAVAGGFLLIPSLGPLGASFSRATTQVTVGALASWFVVKRLGFVMPMRDLSRILLAAMCCGGAARAVIMLVPDLAGLLLAIAAGAVVYLVAIRQTRALPAVDLERFSAVIARMPRSLSPRAQWLLNLVSKRAAP